MKIYFSLLLALFIPSAMAQTDAMFIKKSNGQIVNTNRPIRFTNNIAFTGPVVITNTLTVDSNLTFTGTGHAGLRLNNLTTVEWDAIPDVVGQLAFDSTINRPVIDTSGTRRSIAFLSDVAGGGWPSLQTNVTVASSNTVDSPLIAQNRTGNTNLTQAWLGTNGVVLSGISSNSMQFYAPTGTTAFPGIAFPNEPTTGFHWGPAGTIGVGIGGQRFTFTSARFNVVAANATTTGISLAGDVLLCRTAAAGLQLGFASSSPIAQTLRAAEGNGADIPGADFTLSAGRGTGTGASGKLNFQSHAGGASSSTLGTLITRLCIDTNGAVVVNSNVVYSTSIKTANANSTNFVFDLLQGERWIDLDNHMNIAHVTNAPASGAVGSCFTVWTGNTNRLLTADVSMPLTNGLPILMQSNKFYRVVGFWPGRSASQTNFMIAATKFPGS